MLEKGAEPLFPDMHGADWIAPGEYRISPTASRFENFEFAWALVLATGAAASYALDIGLEPIRQRVRSLTSGLREQLSSLAGVRVLEKSERPAGILTLAFDHPDPFEIVDALRAQGINTSAQAREYAVIDYDQLGVRAALRLSPHYYNTEEEVSQLVEAIAALVLKGS